MKIAIIGAGFCGVALAYHLLQQGHSITLYDSRGIGGGASGIAAGLMHPYAGRFANCNWRGQEGMEATKELLGIASSTLGIPVADSCGLMRMALLPDQQVSFKKCALENPENVLWKSNQESHSLVPGIAQASGIFIPGAITVNCPLYLKGLWMACEKLGGKFEQKTITDLNQLDEERIILATGAHKELHNVPITQVKGQILEYDYPVVLPIAINSQAYIVTQFGTCLAGATFEKTFASPEPDLMVAKRDLEPKIRSLYPALSNCKIIACRAGLRASTPNHLPLVKQINARTWLVTGMGSKGLLYHALFAKEFKF